METIASVIKNILSHSKYIQRSFKNVDQGWKPIYYHWPHELCIIAGGSQNQ